ncbi:MAG TPA: PEP-CTERM sorting domain-containing protein [Rhodocyclaceae bacterium]|nr:PEP-CTERM sorting domain-containing protein [Rhodocyclaceae bacterium]
MRPFMQVLAGTLCLALAALPAAAAEDVVATARQNTVAEVIDTNGGTTANAVFGSASATTTRTRIDAETGSSDAQTRHFDAIGTNKSTFKLWNLGTGSALSTAEAKAIDLSFNFRVLGTNWLDESADSAGSYGPAHSFNMGYSLKVFAGVGYAEADGYTARSCGGSSCSFSPGQSMAGTFDFVLALGWDGATLFSNSGIITMSLQSLSGGPATTRGTLLLESIDLTGGTAPAGGLGIRLDQTGQIIPIATVVPEPENWAMLLAGLAAVAGIARRRTLPS